MRLHSVRLEPSRPSGWFSGELLFGDQITELYGPNGCGKTPVIQSISFALGYQTRFRDDVVSNCRAAVLSLETDDGLVELHRKMGGSFDVEVWQKGSLDKSFYNEKEYSEFLFNLFKLDFPTLTSSSNVAITPYMSTLLPIFYLDQDVGYTGAYR